MNVQKAPVFRNAMGGFNKRDVTEYITRLSRDFEEIKIKHAEEVRKLTDELTSARNELSALRDAESSANSEAVSEELSKANALIGAQTDLLDAVTKEKEHLEAELAKANAKLEGYAEYQDKMEQYESMANRMGEIFMGATAEADRIRSEAKSQSEALLINTQARCDEYRVFLEKKLESFAAMRKNDLERLLDQTQTEINDLLDSFAAKSGEMAEAAACLKFEESTGSEE